MCWPSINICVRLYQDVAIGSGWTKSAASLLTAGWQIGEYQERIELLEMDKELLILERNEVSQLLAAQNAELLKEKQTMEQQVQQHAANEAELDQARAHELTRLAREQGASEARKEADAQVKSLLDAGCAEISALNQQVKILTEQLHRVIASKNASLDLNENASAFSQGGAQGESGGISRRHKMVSSREVAAEEEEWLHRGGGGGEEDYTDDALTERSHIHTNHTAASAISIDASARPDTPEEDSVMTQSGRSQVKILNPQTFPSIGYGFQLCIGI